MSQRVAADRDGDRRSNREIPMLHDEFPSGNSLLLQLMQ
jgi:hypothetical protein